MSASAIAHGLITKTRQSCLLVSYTPLGPKNNETRKLPRTARRSATLPALDKVTARTPSTRCCNDEPARKRSCSQHKASHKHLKKR